MPKFSAYMKGSDGSQGPAGASIIDGILVNEDSLPQQAGHGKHAYLVGTTDPKNLWVWDEENSEWKDQGPIANRIGEVTATMNAIPWTTTAIPSVQTQFSTSNQIDSLNFDFTIPFLDNAYDVINNKVNRDGDIITGDLIISQSSSLYIQQPGNAYTDSNFFVGRTTKTYIGNTYNNDGYTRTGIIQENANGNKEYFRLPISYSTENDNTYDILTNKALVTVGQGGTGVSTATANYVFAAPATNNGSPDFRQLVANDIPDLNANKITDGILNVNRIPDLNASKITDGILPIERGGTNATNAADARANLDVLNKSGDTFNGDFTLPIGNKIKTGNSVYSFITSQAGNNSSNPTVLIQAGGNLLLSGGEFASNALSIDLDSSSTGGKNLYLGSDGNVYLYSNGNTVTNANKWAFMNTGETQLPSALGIAYGGTGNTNGTVAKLTTARTIQTNLASTNTASFDGSADITPGVTGILRTGNGGTGNTEGKAATAVKLAQNRRLLTYLANKFDSTTTNSNYNGQWDLSGNTAIPVYGTLGIANGGTGKTTKDEAWTNLGGGDIGKKDSLEASDIPNLDASKITDGTFNASRIPNLDASKITTGTFNASRIPNLDASKITTGTFNASRIPNLDAGKITTGTLLVGRGGTGVTTYSALAPHVGISTLQIATTKSDTYTFKSDTNGEFAIIFCERGGRAGIYMVDYNTAGSVKVFNVGSIDPLITIQHSANNLDVTITNNNSVTMKITIIEMNTTS